MSGRDPARGADEGVRRARRGRRHRPRHAGGRVLHPARPVGLRQDDDAAHDRRLRATDERADPARRHRRRARAAAPAQRQHGVPELRALPAPRRRRERRLRAQVPQARQGGAGASASPRRSSSSTSTEFAQPQARPALGRPAAARRAGPRARAAPAGAAARRAARRARRAAAQEPPGRAQGAAGRARDHVRVRHPRSGGGAHDERPDRGDEQRPRRAGRPPRAIYEEPAPCSSPTSSASRTCSAPRRSGATATHARVRVGERDVPRAARASSTPRARSR